MTSFGAMLKRDVAPADLIAHAGLHGAHYDELWIVEDLAYAGGISQTTAVLANTQDVIVGHGIAPAPFRQAAALAMEWATLAEMFPGRLHAGLGHGVQSWMGDLGVRAKSPLRLMKETHAAVCGLLAGEHVDVDGDYVKVSGVQLEFPPVVIPPVSLGVTGPKSLELSGAIASGTILSEGHGPEQIVAARQHLSRGAERAGRNSADHRLSVFVAFHIGSPDEMAPRNPEAPSTWEALGEDSESVAEQLAPLVAADVDSIIFVALGANIDQQLDLVAKEVLPALR